jgi:hypothetical protein
MLKDFLVEMRRYLREIRLAPGMSMQASPKNGQHGRLIGLPNEKIDQE